MRPTTSDQIRQAFLDYFEEMGHKVVPSSPLPQDDNPTLLFTNAGMNQFADVFLGKEKRSYTRATSSQKCMRVQGKHNDLENVGPSPRHHTYFEMLGNFSFGDYFKSEAIRYAYEFMTRVCQLPDDRLWYTVHEDDEVAFDVWVNEIGVPARRVLRMGDKTNFWMMGDVGPCGPTSEIHFDWGPEECTCGLDHCSVFLDNDCGRWLEIWNLVFMQYNQSADGTRVPLPKPGVDTGMGLERITSAIQGTPVNYDNDLFRPAMDRVQALLGDTAELRDEKAVGYRVIADHGRAATFLLADGVIPGNVGPGYVLRMIIRRAARFGRMIGFTAPFLAEIADVYIGQMGHVFAELKARRNHVLRTLELEEERFTQSLEAALFQLDDVMADLRHAGRNEISGEAAFNLYATHGLPLEITRDVAQEHGLTVDEEGFAAARDAHAAASGAGAFGRYEAESSFYEDLLAKLIADGRLGSEGVEYDPYSGPSMESVIVALLREESEVPRASPGERIEVVASATPFYVEAGGEVSDTGWLKIPATGAEMRVDETRETAPGLIVHAGELLEGELVPGQMVQLDIDDLRRTDIRRNHTATHILHRELRNHLGTHVLQAGSLVAPDRLRFDFTHGVGIEKRQLAQIERDINETILNNYNVSIEFMDQKHAIEAGALALFGEKYGEIVRTIRIGSPNEASPYSFELCGGLHVRETVEIGLFRFTSQSAVAAGIRRVEAVTGRGAHAFVTQRLHLLDQLAETLSVPLRDLSERTAVIVAENRSLQRDVERLSRQVARSQFESLLDNVQEVDGVNVLAAEVEVPSADGLREMVDWFRDRLDSGVAVFATVVEGKPLIVAGVSEDLIERGIRAGDIVRDVGVVVGGGGGGRPNLAQAGGRDPSKLPQALAKVPKLVRQALK